MLTFIMKKTITFYHLLGSGSRNTIDTNRKTDVTPAIFCAILSRDDR